MKQISQIKSRFWIGGTGREVLQKHGRDPVLMMLYLISGPMASMDGLYWLPLSTLSDHLSMSHDEAKRCIQLLEDFGFCRYDFKTQIVWVVNAASHNLNGLKNPADNRVKSSLRYIEALPKSPLIQEFKNHYGLGKGYPEAPSEAPRGGCAEGNPEAPPYALAYALASNTDNTDSKQADEAISKKAVGGEV